jgi:hypothetical protein
MPASVGASSTVVMSMSRVSGALWSLPSVARKRTVRVPVEGLSLELW